MKTIWALMVLAWFQLIAQSARAETPKAALRILIGPDVKQDDVDPRSTYAELAGDEVPYLVFIPNPAQPDSRAPSQVELDDVKLVSVDCPSLGTTEPFASAVWCGKLDAAHLSGERRLKYTRAGEEKPLEIVVPAARVAGPGASTNPAPGGGGNTGAGAGAGAPCPDPDYPAYKAAKRKYLAKLGRKVEDPSCDEQIQNLKDEDVALIVYRDDGTPVSPLPQVDENDTLIIAISSPGKTLKEVRVTECGAPDPVRVSGGIPDNLALRSASAGESYEIKVVKECSADTGVKLTVVPKTGNTVTIAIPTLALSRITIGLGLLYDFTRTTSWRTDAVKGESVPVLTKDRKAEGLSPVAFIALRPVRVDSKNVRSISQVFAPALGVSLSDPLDHVYVALLAEPWPGLGFLGGWHFHKEETVRGGLVEGDRVPGGVIATDARWQKLEGGVLKNAFLGVYLDSKLFSAILGGLNQ